METPSIKQATPLITVEDVDECLPFWIDRLGFELLGTVPHEDATGFAMLKHGDMQLMYQSQASVQADLGASGAPEGLAQEMGAGTATLFIEVASLDPVIAALGEAPVIVPRRETFYGMDEIFVRAPCGTVVGFAAKLAGDEG